MLNFLIGYCPFLIAFFKATVTVGMSVLSLSLTPFHILSPAEHLTVKLGIGYLLSNILSLEKVSLVELRVCGLWFAVVTRKTGK